MSATAELKGNLGKDLELRFTKNGKAVTNLDVATNDRKTGETTWHRIVVWGKQAEACCQYLKKGSRVMVRGRIGTNKYKNKEGEEVLQPQITAYSVDFLSNFKKAEQQKLPLEETKELRPGDIQF